VTWLHPARFTSLFYYAVGNAQLQHGLSPASALVLLTAAALLYGAARAAFNHLDVH